MPGQLVRVPLPDGVTVFDQPLGQGRMAPVAGASESANPSAIDLYSSAVSNTSRITVPIPSTCHEGGLGGTRTIRDRLPTAARICLTKFDEGRAFGTDSVDDRCRQTTRPPREPERARSSTWVGRTR